VSIAVLFETLVRSSTLAAIVTPQEEHSIWEDDRIVTYTRVTVDKQVAGPAPMGSFGCARWVERSIK